MRRAEAEPQLSLMDGLYRQESRELTVIDDLVANINNIKYIRNLCELSFIPSRIQLDLVTGYNRLMDQLAESCYRVSRYLPEYKDWTRADFLALRYNKQDVGLATSLDLTELYEIHEKVAARFKSAVTRATMLFDTPVFTLYRYDMENITKIFRNAI